MLCHQGSFLAGAVQGGDHIPGQRFTCRFLGNLKESFFDVNKFFRRCSLSGDTGVIHHDISANTKIIENHLFF